MRSLLLRVYAEKIRKLKTFNTEMEKHLKLVVMLVSMVRHKYKDSGRYIMDLIQEGNIALMYAVRKYDPNKGKFSTYARRWILSRMIKESHLQTNIIKTHVSNKKNSVEVVSDSHIDSTSGNEVERIGIENTKEFSENTFDSKILHNTIRNEIQSRMNEILTQKELEIINYTYYNNMSLSEIGEIFNQTKEGIRYIHNKIMNKLKADEEINRLYSLYRVD